MVDKLLRSELGDNWGIDQTTGQLRFFGAGADGSIRFAVDSDTGKAAIEKKNSGVWQGTELIIAPGTLYLGESLGLSAAGHHLMAEHSEGTHKHLYAHRPVTSTGTADEVTVLKLTDHVIREISHSDESTTMVGNALNYQVVATKRVMLEKVYLKTGSTAATAPVTLRVYDGPDNTYPLMWKWTYPIIAFPANSEIELDIPGFLEYEAGETTSAYYSSTAAFSLKGSTGGQPWRATDNYTAIEENMLATTEFVSGNSYTKGEWYVDGATKKVYICNKTGTQTGTFSANSANWSPITADRSGVTGLLSGSILSVPTTSTLSWTAGEGQIVDYSDPSAPAIADLIWDAVASYTPSKLTTDGLHFIAYDSTGTIHDLLGTEITSTHIKDYIIFGRFFIFYGNIVYSESRPMNLGYDAAGSFLDHMLSIEGNGKISGNVYSANGANLSMNVTAGKLFILHGNFRTDPKLPNTLTTSAATAMDISHSVRTTTGRANYYANNAFVDVAKYDDGSGTPATVPAGKWTIQRIYRDGNSATEMALGQQLFDSQEEALVSVGHDNFVEAPEILINSLCGVLIVQAETTNLSLPAQARFVTAGNHRGDGFTDLDGYKDISPNAKRVQTSGLLEGGAITGNTATQVSWGAGNGIITDYTDPEAPAIIKVSWDAVTNHTLTNIAIDDTTIFCYDVSGSIVEVLSSTIAPLDSRRYIGIGSATHRSGAIISTSTAPGNLGYDGVGTLRDFLQYIIGPANISGNVYDANGANMTIDVVGGLALIPGANFRSDSQVPDTPTLASGTAISFSRVYNEGSSSENIAFESTSTTLIDPTKYDDGSGTLATVNTNYWTIQHIFRSRTGGTYVAYGQAQYATKTLAVAALPNISVMEKNPLPLTLYRANLVVKQSATALNDDAQAEFFERSAFRAFGVSGSGSTIPGITSPGGLDTQVQINDGGAFGGDSTLTFNKTTKLLTVQQISGTLADGVTATTQSSGDNSTKVATTAYVSAEALWESATGGVIPKSGISTDIIGSYNNTKILDTCESSFGGFASLLSYSNSKIGTYSLGFPLQANVTNLSSFMISGRDFGDLTDFSNDNDSLEFWIYAGIAPTISTSFVQLGNTANTQVYQWDTLPTIVNGWNKIILKMGDATETGTVDWSTGVDYFEYNIVYSTGGVASTISIDDLRMTSPRKESISRDLALNGDVQVFGTLTGNLLGTINTATTAVTQSAGNNSTLVATTAYADAAVSAGNLWSKAGTVLSPKTAGDAVFIYEGANPICKLWDGDGNDAGTLSLFTGTTQYVHFSADEDSWITGGNLGIGDDDPMSDLHVRCNYPTPSTTVGVTLEQAGLGDCVFHYYLTGGQRIDTGIDNSTTNDDFVIGSGNFGTKYLEINTVTNTVTVSNLLGTLSNGVTATTQTAGNNSTLVATTAFVTSAVSGIVFWSRGGTTLSPNTAGDSILTTGDITGANLTGSKLDIVSTATTTRPMILTANNLTTAPAFYISSNSGDASARYLMELVNNDSNSVLTGGITIDNNGGGSGFDLTNENTTLDALDVDCDSLTTGGIANFKSNSTSTASRSLVTIHNDSTLATGTVGLKIIQDSTGLALETNGDISAGGVRASDGLFQPVYPSDDRLILDLPFREIGSVLQYD
ncbi:MAG: hypothetical protein GY861_24525, partial [bacterium]|nr:hypothetical protein [bacterium]